MSQPSSQSSVTVVIPVWNQWQFTKGCLESLRPTLGIRDQVVVVDNGSEDQTHEGLKKFPWVQVVTNETNRGFAGACNQGAAKATGDIIIFLNNDTLVPNRWIDGLVAPFVNTDVVATGPRSNMVSGPQLVEDPGYTFGSMPELKKFAKRWREEHRGQTMETSRLVGFCLAVRKNEFDAINGFDEGFETGGLEDDDLCLRLKERGGKLLICHESFVHHHGHATFEGNGLDWFEIQNKNVDRFKAKYTGSDAKHAMAIDGVLLSACMIVKDEEDNISECLSSLNGLVDEVVIYDTGSSDNTVELARVAGAKVIEGYWDDDFSRARNASLAECSGQWVLHIDADEKFEGNATYVRNLLSSANSSGLLVEILNLSGNGKNDLTHRPCRLFRKDIYHWEGRLHEQVTFRDGTNPDNFSVLPDVRLIHSGYTPEAMAAKKKGERNIRIAQLDADLAEGADTMDKITNLGRSYTMAGKHEEALNLYNQARTMETSSPVVRRTLYRAGAQASLAVERPEEALAWVEDLSAASKHQSTSHYIRGMAYTDLGRWEEALGELEGLGTDMKDDDGVVYPLFLVQVSRARCYAATGNYEKSADEYEKVARQDSCDEPIWATAIEVWHRAGRDFRKLVKEIPANKMTAIFGQLVQATPEAADAMLDALYENTELRASVLALAIRVAPGMKLERCLEWSARIRSVGMREHCPLIARANRIMDPVEGLRASAVAHATFADDRALMAIETVASTMQTTRFGDALKAINELNPSLLGAVIIAAASTAPRCLDMAKVLHEMGADDEAVAVVMHGASLPSGASVAVQAAMWLEAMGRTQEAAAVRSGS